MRKLARLGGTLAGLLAIESGKVVGMAVPKVDSDGFNRIAHAQPTSGGLGFEAVEVFHGRVAEVLFEGAGEGCGGQAEEIAKVGHRASGCCIALHPVKRHAETVGHVRGIVCGAYGACDENIQLHPLLADGGTAEVVAPGQFAADVAMNSVEWDKGGCGECPSQDTVGLGT